MEVAECEKDRLHLGIAILEVLLTEQRERPPQVGQHALWWLVRELDGTLQDADGNAIVGVGRKENTELRVAVLHCEDIELLLKLLAPFGHQVDVLQHHPMAFAVPDVELRHRHDVLTLPHGNIPIVCAEHQTNRLLAHGLHLFHGVSARRQDEKDGRGARGIRKRVDKDLLEGRRAVAIHVVAAVWQDVTNPFPHCAAHAIRAQAPEHQKLLERNAIKALPVQWQLDFLRGEFIEPLLEARGGVLLHVRAELFEALQLSELQAQAPIFPGQPLGQGILGSEDHRCFHEEVEIGSVEVLGETIGLEELKGEH
mmetsp:Transcript_5507/g.12530  ORF Transcript_5507/g.12530 Transcript_5507/m.12530 type:complete len:311 (-) Transcript_5507:2438-3370(-)